MNQPLTEIIKLFKKNIDEPYGSESFKQNMSKIFEKVKKYKIPFSLLSALAIRKQFFKTEAERNYFGGGRYGPALIDKDKLIEEKRPPFENRRSETIPNYDDPLWLKLTHLFI